jgi:chitin disaccharide deacetylase
LIVNADDFGACHGVNRGIIEAHEHGIVTSASLMVDGGAAAEAAEFAHGPTKLGVGLHVELRRWRRGAPLREGAAVSAGGVRRHARRELQRQLERFRLLVGREPTHLDSHQHRHRWPLVQPIFEHHARELGLPLRRTPLGIRFCGDFYGHDGDGRPDPGAITVDSLIRLLEELPEGATELCCHPGYVDDLKSWYRLEREQEVRVLCDPRVREAVRRHCISLCTFSDLRLATDGTAAATASPRDDAQSPFRI